MILYLLVDLEREKWRYTKKDIYDDLIIFLNAFRMKNKNNKILIVQNNEIVFDSLESNITNIVNIESNFSVNDLGYILCKCNYEYQEEHRILIFTLSKVKNNEYLKYLNCMFTASRLKIRIDVFSLYENSILKQCASVTDGLYSSNEYNCLKFLLSTLGNKTSETLDNFIAKCYCHDRSITLGLTCPICLAIYCRFIPVCKRCKTKFNFNSNLKVD